VRASILPPRIHANCLTEEKFLIYDDDILCFHPAAQPEDRTSTWWGYILLPKVKYLFFLPAWSIVSTQPVPVQSFLGVPYWNCDWLSHWLFTRITSSSSGWTNVP
jgi:hypothetical protein